MLAAASDRGDERFDAGNDGIAGRWVVGAEGWNFPALHNDASGQVSRQIVEGDDGNG
jgi:hypothetical protein